jgi:hypothetical protein
MYLFGCGLPVARVLGGGDHWKQAYPQSIKPAHTHPFSAPLFSLCRLLSGAMSTGGILAVYRKPPSKVFLRFTGHFNAMRLSRPLRIICVKVRGGKADYRVIITNIYVGDHIDVDVLALTDFDQSHL